MATRLDMFRKNGTVVKSFMDSVFLKNRAWDEMSSEDVMAQPYKKSDLCYICISTTARAIGQIPIKVYKRVREEEFKPLPRDDPWQLKFERPSYLMDRYSFVEAMVGFLMHDGDVFIIPYPPGAPMPSSFWVVRKRHIRPIRDKQTNSLVGWLYNPKRMVYEMGGADQFGEIGGGVFLEGDIPLSVDEVAHVFFWNPYDPIMGMAPHEAGRLNIMIDYKASHYTANFFDEGAQPGGMLSTERSLSDKQFQRVLSQFETKHQGYKKSHRFALLENGLTYTQAGLSQKDMEFPKLRELTARRIFQIYGMKEAIISETRTVNRATGQEERKEWWESTNLPIMRMICSALNFAIFPEGNLSCQFDTTKIEALRESLKDKTETAYKLWQMGATFNDINQRLDLGLKRYPWGDTWYMPVNLIPVDQQAPPPIDVTPPAEEENLIGYEEKKMLPDLRKSREEAIWNSMIRQASPLEDSFAKKTSRVFYNMRRRSLELLYKKKTAEETTKDIDDVDKELFWEEFKEIRKVSTPLFREALGLGVLLIIQETGASIAVDPTDPEAILFLTNKTMKIQGIVQTVKNQIRTELVDGFKIGESIDQIADRIRSVFNMAESRTRVIARTEIIGAANEGRYLAIRRSGFKEKMWFTALDERVRLQHRPMHGQVVRVGEIWTMPDGSLLRHPGDHEGPPHQIISCRCAEMVVIPETS